jgi:ribosomal-protein-alanine N-acetyltransferase
MFDSLRFNCITHAWLGAELEIFERSVLACAWTKQDFDALMKNRGILYTARTDTQELVGYLLVQNQIDLYEVLQLSVHPDYRQQGIAKQLLTLMMTQTQSEPSEGVFLEVRESNLSAISLYEKLGFLQVGKRKNYYPCISGEREDALLMRYDFL